jgi:hypothetical protein
LEEGGQTSFFPGAQAFSWRPARVYQEKFHTSSRRMSRLQIHDNPLTQIHDHPLTQIHDHPLSWSGTDTLITMAVLNLLSYNQRNQCSNIWYAIYIPYAHTDNSGLLIRLS